MKLDEGRRKYGQIRAFGLMLFECLYPYFLDGDDLVMGKGGRIDGCLDVLEVSV